MSFIGEQEVENIEKNVVTFKDGTKQKFTKKQLEYLVTEEATDPTVYMGLVVKAVTPDILEILEKHDIRNVELGYIFDSVKDSWNAAYKIAIGKGFGTYKEGQDFNYFTENIRISDIKRLKDKK